MINHAKLCSNITKTNSGPTISAANGTDMPTNHTGTVPISPSLSQQAQQRNIMKSLSTRSLIYIAQLCDDDCIAIFTKNYVQILRDDKIIITGTRYDQNGLWNIPLTPKTSQVAASALSCHQIKSDLASFLHGSAFIPISSTLLHAIKRGHLSPLTGLTTSLIKKISWSHSTLARDTSEDKRITSNLPKPLTKISHFLTCYISVQHSKLPTLVSAPSWTSS